MARVLLVDDDPDQTEIRALILERSGHAVSTAGNAAEGLREYESRRPDVVVMDLRLPRSEDGAGLIRALRERSPSVRIFLLSGWPEELADRPEAGMIDRILRKPVRSRDLVELINEVA